MGVVAEGSERLFFDSVKEHRGVYFVEYHPPVANHKFATLDLVFAGAFDPRSVAHLMQVELHVWLRRYPVPLMVSAWAADENLIEVNATKSTHLVGWVEEREISSSWQLSDLDEFLKSVPANQDWRATYRDIGVRTAAQVKANAERSVEKEQRQIFALKRTLVLWLSVLPAVWATMQFLGPEWLGAIVLAYSLWQSWRAWLRIIGRHKRSPTEIAEAEKRRKMEHYYYHCERNPDGFARLRAENFKNETIDGTRKEAAELAKSERPL